MFISLNYLEDACSLQTETDNNTPNVTQ